jgi:hypothetical protein
VKEEQCKDNHEENSDESNPLTNWKMQEICDHGEYSEELLQQMSWKTPKQTDELKLLNVQQLLSTVLLVYSKQ